MRDVHEHAKRRRAAERRQRIADAQARRERAAADARVADLDAHPERRLLEGLDVLADTWLPDTGEFVAGSQLARLWLRRAVSAIFTRESIGALDVIEVQLRSWFAAHPDFPQPLCDAVRVVLRDVITNVHAAAKLYPAADLVGVILPPSTRTTHDNERPPPTPHLRI